MVKKEKFELKTAEQTEGIKDAVVCDLNRWQKELEGREMMGDSIAQSGLNMTPELKKRCEIEKEMIKQIKRRKKILYAREMFNDDKIE